MRDNLSDPVRRAAESDPSRPALLSDGRTLTWAELDAKVDAIARGLQALDLAADDHAARVIVALPNVPEFAAVFFGVLRAGLVAVPVNPGYSERELSHVVADSGAKVIVGRAAAGLAAYPLKDLKNLEADGGAVAPTTGGDDLAVLLYTSGTSGTPKGAMLSHRAILANHEQLSRIEPPVLTPDDRMLLAVPLFHAYGLGTGLCGIAYHGATGVLMERFDPTEALAAVTRHEVTVVLGVPPMYVAWSLQPELGEAFASVRLAVSGAAPLDPTAARRFMEATRHPVFEGYGLTETAPALTSTLVSQVPKPGSVGQAIPGVSLKLVDAEGRDVSQDDDDEEDDDPMAGAAGTDPGQIVVRGDNLFDGYWPSGEGGPDEEGWWPTGDVAYADGDGDLYIIDRLGELILVSGFNVYPREVELVLQSHPAVTGAAVVGVPHPYTGETVKAYVVSDSSVTGSDLITFCEGNLARFKCPTSVEFVDTLPRSITGKVRKGELP